jgi:putative transcriptional regulator
MKKIKKEIQFPFDEHDLVNVVENLAAGVGVVKKYRIKVSPPVKPIPAKDIRAIRMKLGFTQPQFASFLNVPKITAVSWENGTRKPSGAALRLLAVARKHPEALEAV